MKIKISKATPDDATGIRQVLNEAWYMTYPNKEYNITLEDIKYQRRDLLTKESIDVFKTRLTNIPDTDLRLVVKDEDVNNKIVGVSLVRKESTHNRLHMLCVLPEYQGKGIGTLLWSEFQKFIDTKLDTFVNVAIYSEQAISFYKKCGFIDTGKRFSDEESKMRNGATIPEMGMVLKA